MCDVGLSYDAKIGIAAGCSIGGMIILFLLIRVCTSYYNKYKKEERDKYQIRTDLLAEPKTKYAAV